MGFDAIEGLKEEDEEDDDFVDSDDEEKTSASSKPLKKEPKTISFTKGDLNIYLMSKESQEILENEKLKLPSVYYHLKTSLEIIQKDYNKAEEKI